LTITNITPTNRAGNGSFRVNVTANTGAQRSGTITVTVPGASSRSFTVTQATSAFTITLDPNGGVVNPASVTRNSGENVGTLPVPSRVGHLFLGWFSSSSSSGGIAIFPDRPVISNMTVFARWEAISITFNPNGGVLLVPESRPITPGAPLGPLPAHAQAQMVRQGGTLGHRFVGWYTHATGGDRVTAATLAEPRNMLVHARWESNVDIHPTRIRYPWWRTNNIPLRTFRIDSDLGSYWQDAMNQGMANWNNSTAPVNFHTTSSSRNVVETYILNGTYDSLGRIRHTYTWFTGRYNHFRIRLCPINIFNHADRLVLIMDNVIESVMAHELGHAVGLRDGENLGGSENTSIMNGGRNRNDVRGPTEFDIASVRLVYDD